MVDSLDAPLDAAAEAAAKLPAAPPGAFCSEVWHAAGSRSGAQPAAKRARLGNAAAAAMQPEQQLLEGAVHGQYLGAWHELRGTRADQIGTVL